MPSQWPYRRPQHRIRPRMTRTATSTGYCTKAHNYSPRSVNRCSQFNSNTQEVTVRLIAIVLSNGATSLVSLMITILVGRQDGPSQLGIFGVAFAAILITQLFVQEIGLNRALSNPADPAERQVAYSRSLTVALLVGGIMLIGGLIMVNPLVIATGVALPGYIAFTFLRLLTMTEGQMSRGFLADGLLVSAVAMVSAYCVINDISALPVVITWAAVLPVSIAFLQKRLGVKAKVRWTSNSQHYSGMSFGIQNLVGSGS